MNKLYILCGIPFSGKTTLARKLVEILDYLRIDLDDIKFELFGKDITDEEIDQEGWNKIYQQMYDQIKKALQRGKTVVHDTGNFTYSERQIVRKIAEQLGIEAITIFVNTSLLIARQRLLENRNNPNRFNISDESFENAVAEMEPPTNTEKHLIFDTDTNVEEWTKLNLSR